MTDFTTTHYAKILPSVLRMLPVRLFVQAGPLPKLDISGRFQSILWNVLQLKLLLLCLLYSCLLVALSPFGYPLVHFSFQNQLLICLVLLLVAARCLVGQFDSPEQEGKAFTKGSLISLNVTTSGDPILLF